MRKRIVTGIWSLGILLAGASAVPLVANVYLQPEETLAEHFEGATIERRPVYLSRQEQSALSEALNGTDVGRFYTFYIARRAGQLVGFATFDTHRVRSKPETLFIALRQDGSVDQVRVVSFFEPEDYLPPNRWLDLLDGEQDLSRVRAGGRVPIMSGATLTSHAVTRSVRQAMWIHRNKLAGQ